MRIFKTKGAARFARRQRIDDTSLREAVERAERGQIDVDLGSGLIKQRIARPDQGRSGGFRMIVSYMAAGRAVFLYGFAKSDRDNIEDDELRTLRTIGTNWLAAPIEIVEQAVEQGNLTEVKYDDKKA